MSAESRFLGHSSPEIIATEESWPCRSPLCPLLVVHGCGLAAPVLHLWLHGFKAKVVGIPLDPDPLLQLQGVSPHYVNRIQGMSL